MHWFLIGPFQKLKWWLLIDPRRTNSCLAILDGVLPLPWKRQNSVTGSDLKMVVLNGFSKKRTNVWPFWMVSLHWKRQNHIAGSNVKHQEERWKWWHSIACPKGVGTCLTILDSVFSFPWTRKNSETWKEGDTGIPQIESFHVIDSMHRWVCDKKSH